MTKTPPFRLQSEWPLVLWAALTCACNTPSEATDLRQDSPHPTGIDSTGGNVEGDGARIDIPADALDREVQVAVNAMSAPSRTELPELPVSDSDPNARLVFSSEVFAMTPHGTQFSTPVHIQIPYRDAGHVVVRLDDESDNSWEIVQGAVFDAGVARFEVTQFSLYAVARVSDFGTAPDSTAPMPGNQPPQPGPAPKLGEYVVEVHDSGTRSYGNQRLIFDDGHLYWTRDVDGKLSVLAADVTQPLPAEPKVLFEAPWAASSGWSNPPLLATSTHLVLPVIGVIDRGAGLVDSDGWATLRKDGSGFQLGVLDNWWIVARGSNVIVETFYEGTFSISPESGEAASIEEFPSLSHDASCIYDPAQDQAGCLAYGIVAYDFKTSTPIVISEANSIQGPQFGSPRLAFNSTHWFAPIELPSGAGIGAFARNGSGAARYYEELAAF